VRLQVEFWPATAATMGWGPDCYVEGTFAGSQYNHLFTPNYLKFDCGVGGWADDNSDRRLSQHAAITTAESMF